MAYLAVDQLGIETIHDFEPYRCGIELPKGTIEKIIGRTLTWTYDPYDLG